MRMRTPCPEACPDEMDVMLSHAANTAPSLSVRYLSRAINSGQPLTLSRPHTPCNGCGTRVAAGERHTPRYAPPVFPCLPALTDFMLWVHAYQGTRGQVGNSKAPAKSVSISPYVNVLQRHSGILDRCMVGSCA